jgi:hypothetical protein
MNQYYLGRKAQAERNLRWALEVTDPDGRPPAILPEIRPDTGVAAGGTEALHGTEPVALGVLAIQDSLQDTLARVTREQLAKIRGAR